MDNIDIASLLFPSLAKLITLWIGTGLLLFFFYKFFWKKLKAYLEERQNFMASKIENSRLAEVNAQSYERNAKDELQKARLDSKTIIERSKNDALRVKEDIVSDAKKEANNKMEEARLEINREKMAARKEIESEIVDIALTAAREVVKESIDKNKSEKIVDDFIKELKA